MFKAGDRVRRINDSYNGMKVDDVATVDYISIVGHVRLREFEGDHSVKCLELLPEGPVRTVTRREIVPGVYGKVRVNECGIGGGVESIEMRPTRSPEELREASHIFNQLAEALEEKP